MRLAADHIRQGLERIASKVGFIPRGGEFEVMAQRIGHCQDLDARNGGPRNVPASDLKFSGAKAAAKLAAELRRLFAANDVDPLFLLSRWPDHLGIHSFSTDAPALSGASVLFGGTACHFISATTPEDTLYIYARGIADLLRLRTRRQQVDTCIFYPGGRKLYQIKGPAQHFSDAFALELLIPRRGLAVAFEKVRTLLRINSNTVGDIELLYLSRIFGVSFHAMAKRCERLGLLPPQGASSILEFVEGKFGGPEKRAQELGIPPRPDIEIQIAPPRLAQRLALLVKQNGASIEDLSRLLGVPNQLIIAALRTAGGPSDRFWD